MPASLLSTRPVSLEPNAGLQASRAMRRAEADHDAVRSLAASARDLAQLVQRCSAEVERLALRRRQLGALETENGQRLAAGQLDSAVHAAERHGQALSEQLRSVEMELEGLDVSGGAATQRDDLLGQLEGDGADLHAALGDLARLREEGGEAPALTRGREAAQRAGGRRQDALEEAASARVARAEAQAGDAAEGHRAPPMQLLPELESFVREWNTIAQDPRGLGQPGSELATTDGRVAALQGRWASWNLRTRAPRYMDPNEMTQWIMRQAYRDNTLDMRAYAMRLEFHTELKRHLREELNRARLHRSENAPKPGSSTMTSPYARKQVSLEPNIDDEGNWNVREPAAGEQVDNAETMQEYIRELEQALQTAGDDMQLSQIELQAMTQRQQQMLNTLSSLSKAQHETSMSILRKIGT